MTKNIIDLRTAIAECAESTESFPVDFDAAWQWVGYSRKSDALKVLKNNFVEGEEFCGNRRKNPNGGRPSVSYQLTTDCFKAFCMMAGTNRGKQVRRYFIQCENELKSKIATQPKAIGPSVEERLHMLHTAMAGLKLIESPRHMQLLQDHAAKLLGETQHALPAVKLRGVAEIAEDLGFSPYQVRKVGSGLGKVIAAWYRSENNAEPMVEKRLFNGRMAAIKVYEVTPELENMVAGFLRAKGLSA